MNNIPLERGIYKVVINTRVIHVCLKSKIITLFDKVTGKEFLIHPDDVFDHKERVDQIEDGQEVEVTLDECGKVISAKKAWTSFDYCSGMWI